MPRCIPVPAGQRVTLRFASPDVIHGILVAGTNVNTMVVPGYVSEVHAAIERTGDLLMPCHEYCGIGHSEMWATLQLPTSLTSRRGRYSCGFDLCLSPIRSLDAEGFQTAQHRGNDLREAGKALIRHGKMWVIARWATVRVLPPDQWRPDQNGKVSCDAPR